MSAKSVWLSGLLVLGAVAANAQAAQPIYWSTDAKLNCGAYGKDNLGTPMTLTAGPGAGGFVCYVYGTLPWYAAGAGWGSSVRMSAPPTAPVAYFLDFADENGGPATLDFIYQGDPKVYSGLEASQALFANQPLEVQILGLSSLISNYSTISHGPVTVLAECPDANTCGQVQAQLIYSTLPAKPWSLSAPVIWDYQTSLAWSSVVVDDSKTNQDQNTSSLVSFVIYNLDTSDATKGPTSHSYTLNVYDMDGKLSATAVTKVVPALGSYADTLANVFPTLPAGAFKLQVVSPVVGPTANDYIAFEALQFHGPSATTLVAAPEVIPTAAAAATPASSPMGRGRRLLPSALQSAAPSHAAR